LHGQHRPTERLGDWDLPCLNEGRDKEDLKYVRAFVRDFWRFKNRRVFSTADGSAILANKDARPDDLIVALHGGTVPFVLQSKGGTTYRSLGPCLFFAKKWMDSEAVRYKKENNVPDERFDLGETSLTQIEQPQA
jgi:hypothetical protein